MTKQSMRFMEISKLISQVDNIEDLTVISNLLRDRYSYLQTRTARAFRMGDRVSWYSAKRGGMKLFGIVQKVNKKTIKVRTNEGVLWSVSPSLLESDENWKEVA